MSTDKIDDILQSEKTITPSPDFLASVMRAVRRQATALPPMKFPWMRLLPAIVAMFIAIMRVAWDLLSFVGEPDVMEGFKAQMAEFAGVAAQFGVQWVVLALAVTTGSLLLAISLVGSQHYGVEDSRLQRLLRGLASVLRRT